MIRLGQRIPISGESVSSIHHSSPMLRITPSGTLTLMASRVPHHSIEATASSFRLNAEGSVIVAGRHSTLSRVVLDALATMIMETLSGTASGHVAWPKPLVRRRQNDGD